MAATGKKPSSVLVIRDRNTTALPPMQLGSFHKLFEPDSYEGAEKFKARFHINEAGIAALEASVQAKCIDAHFATMKKEVAEFDKAAKEAGKRPILKIVEDASGCQSARDFVQDKLRDPFDKDRVQLPTIRLDVAAYRPTKPGQEPELRVIIFWDAMGNLIENPKEVLKKMTAGTWCKPVVHSNLFLSQQNGPAPRPQLQLVGLQIVKLVEWGSAGEQAPDAADDDEMRRIMGDDYSAADDLSSLGLKQVSSRDAESGLELEEDSPF